MSIAEELAEKHLRAAANDGELRLSGCCSYEETWKPGIKGWGATDEESFEDAELPIPLVRGRMQSAINEALERAAQVADTLECGDPTPRWTIAFRIRALKGGA